MTTTKTSWPEVVGKPIDEAVEIIQRESPELQVVKVADGEPLTRDLQPFRVRVFHDSDGNTSSVPTIG